jgi:hypothetical protein
MRSRHGRNARRNRATLLMGMIAMTSTVVSATPASAAGSGLVYPSKVFAAPRPDVTHGDVTCPDSHPNVTGGGIEITGDESTLDLEAGETRPLGPHKWTAGANNSSVGGASMKITAICSKGTFTVVQDNRAIDANSQASLDVLCPTGTQLSGGGVEVGGDSHKNEVATTEPLDGPDAGTLPDDGWFGTGNNGLDQPVALFVFAVCASDGSFKYPHSIRRAVDDNNQVSAAVFCPAGTHVTGGGVEITGNDDGIEVADSFPVDGGDTGRVPDNGWRGTVNNDNTGGTHQMQAFAICRG